MLNPATPSTPGCKEFQINSNNSNDSFASLVEDYVK